MIDPYEETVSDKISIGTIRKFIQQMNLPRCFVSWAISVLTLWMYEPS